MVTLYIYQELFKVTFKPIGVSHHYRRNRGAHMHENCTPSHHLHLRQITTSQVLKASAAGRTPYAATEIAKSVVVGVDRKQGGNRQMR